MKWIRQIRLFFEDQRKLKAAYKEHVAELVDLSERATIMLEAAKRLNQAAGDKNPTINNGFIEL